MADPLCIEGVHQVALTVSDLDKSQEFYAGILGLEVVARFEPPGLMFCYAGEVRLSLQRVEKVEAVSSVIYFRVASIQDAVDQMKASSVRFEREAELVFRDEKGQFGDAGEEEWMAFFRDPDNHLLALVSRTGN